MLPDHLSPNELAALKAAESLRPTDYGEAIARLTCKDGTATMCAVFLAERTRAEKWREIAYLLYIWEHNQERPDEPDYGTCKPNCYRCDAARKHDALRRYEDDHAPLPKEPKAMCQWARNNPEKIGSDPTTHVPGYGSPQLSHDSRPVHMDCNVCRHAPDYPHDRRMTLEELMAERAGAAALAENDKQAAELGRYIEHKDVVMRALAAAADKLRFMHSCDGACAIRATQITALIAMIEGTEG